jgi:DNA-binding LytR/AlgR family response regulator
VTLDTPLLCDLCRQHLDSIPRIVVHALGQSDRLLSPLQLLAVNAAEKGTFLYTEDGEKYFEFLTIKELLASYPDILFRVNRDWLVRTGSVVGHTKSLNDAHTLVLRGGLVVPVSRRFWPQVAHLLGLKGRRWSPERKIEPHLLQRSL